jgi:hypothetical protein
MSSPFSEIDQHVRPTLTPTQQFWLGHWQQWQVSGLSMAAYAREQGLSVKSFYYWSKQVCALKADRKPEPAQAAHFHPVRIIPPAVTSPAEAMTVLLRLPNGIEGELRHVDVPACLELLTGLCRLPA